jgi:hypothetical protein
MTVLSAAIDSEQNLRREQQAQRRSIMEEQKKKQEALAGAQPKNFVHMHPAAVKRG